jgi:hypothetical protein
MDSSTYGHLKSITKSKPLDKLGQAGPTNQ